MNCRRNSKFYSEEQLRREFNADRSALLTTLISVCELGLSIQNDYISLIIPGLKEMAKRIHTCAIYHNTLLRILRKCDKEKAAPLFPQLLQLRGLCLSLLAKWDAFADLFIMAKDEVNQLKDSWMREPVPDAFELARMTRQERWKVIQLWQGRLTIALGARSSFADIKAEWDAMEMELDWEAYHCRMRVEILLREFQQRNLIQHVYAKYKISKR